MALEPGIVPAGEPQSFEEYLLRVNPTKAALTNLAALDDETPIIMLNLLRFRPRGDPRIYAMYGKDAAPEVAKTKSYIGFFGMTIRDLDPAFGLSSDWDGIVLPVYRRRAAFLQLQQSPIYQRAIPLRTAGTFSRLLYALQDGVSVDSAELSIQELNTSREPILAPAQNCILLELGRLRPEVPPDKLHVLAQSQTAAMAPVGGSLRIQAQTQVPVVSEAHWDFCHISGFENNSALSDYLASVQAKEMGELRAETCETSLFVAANQVELPT